MRVRRDRTALAVAGLAVVALAVRLAALGRRVAHFDEARVAYWTVEYVETGVLFYRPIIHGPLLQHLNAGLFGLFGAGDLVMRLVPALVGGLLPLSALLFRRRLSREAVVSLAFLLALNPVLVYYSRFMRGDILAGAASFVAFACLLRAVDLDDGRYLYPATVALAVGFGAKENVLAYLLAFAARRGCCCTAGCCSRGSRGRRRSPSVGATCGGRAAASADTPPPSPAAPPSSSRPSS